MASNTLTPAIRRCEACGAPLLQKAGEKPVHYRKRKYCGYACSRPRGGPIPQPVEARFARKVQVTDGCHLWAGAKNSDGYGSFNVGGVACLAHRVAYDLAHGSPGSAQVLHRCDNPACVNPDHLFLGDHADNMADMARKGRGRTRVGPAHHAAKLDPEKVRSIRADPREHRVIAKDYGVSHMVIGAVKRRETWKHVD